MNSLNSKILKAKSTLDKLLAQEFYNRLVKLMDDNNFQRISVSPVDGTFLIDSWNDENDDDHIFDEIPASDYTAFEGFDYLNYLFNILPEHSEYIFFTRDTKLKDFVKNFLKS